MAMTVKADLLIHQSSLYIRKSWMVYLSALFLTFLSNSIYAVEVEKINSSENYEIISKFKQKKEAEKLLDTLLDSRQPVKIITKKIPMRLKSLSLGPYLNKDNAIKTKKKLKANGINAFINDQKNGTYRVYAGALGSEKNYWTRFEQLEKLGFKRIHTQFKHIHTNEYYVIRDKNSLNVKLKPQIIVPKITKTFAPPPVLQKSPSIFNNQFESGRFKGELSGWKNADDTNSSNYFSAAVSAKSTYLNKWHIVYGGRFEATEQSSNANYEKYRLHWLPTFIELKQKDNQWLAGAIDARWEKGNDLTLSDHLSSRMLTRYRMDSNVIDKRRPSFGFRWKLTKTQHSLDVILLPLFRPPKMPVFGSIWHPVNQTQPSIIGLKKTDTLKELIQKGNFADETYNTGGLGARMGQRKGSRSRAITILFTRYPEPYYQLDPGVATAISSGTTIDDAISAHSGTTFTPTHPYTGMFSWEEKGKISHFELALFTDTPYTTELLEMKTAISFSWLAGFKYPKMGKNKELVAYFKGSHLNTKETILDRKTKFIIVNKFFHYLPSYHIQFGLESEIDLDQFGIFINPQIHYKQNKYLNLSLSYQLFAGAEQTESGFHQDHSILSLIWQAVF